MAWKDDARARAAVRQLRYRFPIRQDVRYQCQNGSNPTSGTGKTLEISSREVRFTTQHALEVGEPVELAVDWPALLDNTCLMKLFIHGCVVESAPGSAAIRIERHEFRTRGSRAVAQSAARSAFAAAAS